jgi:hypothetical protein
MTTKRFLLVAMALSLAVVIFWPSMLAGKPSAAAPDMTRPAPRIEAPSQQRWHAVVGFWNRTDQTIAYHFRWGDRPAKPFILRPGERRAHSWHFATPDVSTWPDGYVRFNRTVRSGHETWTTVRVHATPALDRGYVHGSQYGFMVVDGHHVELLRIYGEFADR